MLRRILTLLLFCLLALQVNAQYKPKRDTSKDRVEAAPTAHSKSKEKQKKDKDAKPAQKTEKAKSTNKANETHKINKANKTQPSQLPSQPSITDSLPALIPLNTLMRLESFDVDKTDIIVPQEGGTDSIRVRGHESWHVSVEPNRTWIKMDIQNKQITFSVLPNRSTIPRTDFMVITNNEKKIRIQFQQQGRLPQPTQ